MCGGKPKHPLPHTLLFLVTPSKQHLGTKERVSPSPLHTAAAKGTECSSDTITSAPPWTSHTLEFYSRVIFSLNLKKYNVLYNLLAQNQIFVCNHFSLSNMTFSELF